MPRHVFLGSVNEQGLLSLDDLDYWREALKGFSGKRVRVTLSKETKQRTNPQNSWLWGAVYPAIADWSGHSVDEIHEAMKALHGHKTLVTLPGHAQELVPRSTRDYTTDEFSEYVERVRAWAAMQGLDIPDPGRLG